MIDEFDLNFVGLSLLFLVAVLAAWVNWLEKRMQKLEGAASPSTAKEK